VAAEGVAAEAGQVMDGRNIRLTLAYDGTDFYGWQVQQSGRTVQGVLQAALERMHGHAVRVVGAGRTDSGVHATGQVANFSSDLDSVPPGRFREAVNSFLPRDVRVLESVEADPRFHARRWARQRVYRYYICCSQVLLPHRRNYCHWMKRKPDIRVLNGMASRLVGEHDFSAFAADGDANESKVRAVAVSSFHAESDMLVYTIAANAFLWKMVRTIVGTFLELEEQGAGAAAIADVLASRDHGRAGGTAPARGLFLERVVYDAETLGSPEPAGGLPADGVFPDAP
jgi:tRNA pseudouridine38-40 synthase